MLRGLISSRAEVWVLACCLLLRIWWPRGCHASGFKTALDDNLPEESIPRQMLPSANAPVQPLISAPKPQEHNSCVDCTRLSSRWTIVNSEGQDYLWQIQQLRELSRGKCKGREILNMSPSQYAAKCVVCCTNPPSKEGEESKDSKQSHTTTATAAGGQQQRRLAGARERDFVLENLNSLKSSGMASMALGVLSGFAHDLISHIGGGGSSLTESLLRITYTPIRNADFWIHNPSVTVARKHPWDTFTIVGSRRANDGSCVTEMRGYANFEQEIEIDSYIVGAMSSFATTGSWMYFRAIRFELAKNVVGTSAGQVLITPSLMRWCKKFSFQKHWQNRDMVDEHRDYMRAGEGGNTLFGVHNIDFFSDFAEETRMFKEGDDDQKLEQMLSICARTFVASELDSTRATHRLAAPLGVPHCNTRRRTDHGGLPDVTLSGSYLFQDVKFRDNGYNFCHTEAGFFCV